MGSHLVRAFLICERETAWELMENLLMAAQRQEGLRQVILEGVAEAHPLAFRRMIRLIIQEDLLRFSAAIAATNRWFGFNWKAEDKKTIQNLLEDLTAIGSEEEAITAILQGDDPQKIHPALWSSDGSPRLLVLGNGNSIRKPDCFLITDSSPENVCRSRSR